MKKTYVATIVREIKSSFGRFIAIFAIVALGVGFLSGLLATTPDMYASVDHYYDEYRMSDIFIKATMGLTKGDVDTVSSMEEVEQLMPAYVTDTLMKTSQDEVLVTRVYGLPLEKQESGSDGFINRLELIEGRMPQNPGECVVERSGGYLAEIRPGTTLTISEENEDFETIDDTFHMTEYTVVGIVGNPFYFGMEREQSSIGNGRLGAIIYVDESSYALDVYTDFYITVKDALDLTAFSDEYETTVEDVAEKLEVLGETQSAVRYGDIVKEARTELEKGKQEYADAKAEAETKLADALEEIESGKSEIAKGEAKLSDGRKELSDGERKLAGERSNYEAQIQSSEETLSSGEKEISAAEKTLADSKAKLDAVQKDIEQAKALLASGIDLPDETRAQIQQYDAGLEAYQTGMTQLAEKKAELESGRTSLEQSKKEAETRFTEAAEKLKKARNEIEKGETELKNSRQKLSEGEAEYQQAKLEAEEELRKAEREIADAEQQINEIETPKWYVLDRRSNVSYASFSINAEKVADISTVFPFFFFLIAALVSLTTMTRMVEEERTQIGTLKALGYSKGAIMSKYIIYCGLATVLGSIAGLLTGFQLLPAVLWNAYAMMYHLPNFIPQFRWGFAIIALMLAVLCTMTATISACNHALGENPAKLMLPSAPKAGKRIFLERIRFIWSRMTFTHKATARNILRYKKHFFMTITGIAGCTALIVTGFGLRDSFGVITDAQYNDIFRYDLRIELNENEPFDTVLNAFLNDPNQVEKYIPVYSETGKALLNGNSASATTYIPEDTSRFEEFIHLRDRKTGAAFHFDEASVVMTEKLAETLGLHAGESFTFENADGVRAEFVLTGITENYVGSYVYINQKDYEQAFGTKLINALLVKTMLSGDVQQQDAAIEALLGSDAVSGAEFVSQARRSFDNLLSSIDFIVLVLIGAAGALAVIVLYNLTNININERRKELATLKVLGFHHEEVAGYIFRETTVLSIVGTIAGLLLGILLHAFVIKTAETADLMAGKSISLLSYVLSAAVTLVFSGIVDFMMYWKLKKIEMVDSMKAID